jgi:tRNA pseudouridine55 synthase
VNPTGGLVVLDKGPGVTSFQALLPLKRWFGRRTKVGHAGTLDPFATGVLVVLVGDATRLCDLAMSLPKTYEATVRFGVATDTLDPDGQVVLEVDVSPTPPATLPAAVTRFRGEIEQRPPAWSALKVGGERAYARARRGEEVELAPRRVVVHEIAIEETRWPEVRLRIRCGAGTYVRAIARDLGDALGLPASLAALRRTAIGPYRAEEGLRIGEEHELTPEEIAPALRSSLELTRAAGLMEVALDDGQAVEFWNGRPSVADDAVTAGKTVAVLHASGTLLGTGEIDLEGRVRPVRVFSSARDALRR